MWQKQASREHLKKPKHGTFLPWCLGGIVVCLLVVQVIVSNRLATSGSTIDKVESEIGVVTQANQSLEEKIASYSALSTLKAKAEALGFIKPVAPQYLSPELPVALDLH